MGSFLTCTICIEFSPGTHICILLLHGHMLVSNNVQWSIEKKHFLHHYVVTHKARFTYMNIEDVVICVAICKSWTASCLCCPIAKAKVLFPH